MKIDSGGGTSRFVPLLPVVSVDLPIRGLISIIREKSAASALGVVPLQVPHHAPKRNKHTTYCVFHGQFP